MRQDLGCINTGDCSFDKETGAFQVSSKKFGGSFPRRVQITSCRTGKVVEFQPIGPDHPKFCHDGWDGELAVYEPVNPVLGVTILTISHGQ